MSSVSGRVRTNSPAPRKTRQPRVAPEGQRGDPRGGGARSSTPGLNAGFAVRLTFPETEMNRDESERPSRAPTAAPRDLSSPAERDDGFFDRRANAGGTHRRRPPSRIGVSVRPDKSLCLFEPSG